MIALGAVLPFSGVFSENLKIFFLFFLIFLFVAAFYSLIFSLVLALKNFKKFRREFNFLLKKKRRIIYPVLLLGLIFMLLGLFEILFFSLGIFIFIIPYFYLYAKAVDEASMIQKIKTNKLVEGDWLYKNLRVGGKSIEAKWEGLKKADIKAIRKKYKTVFIRQGMPFAPVFLISFLILMYLWKSGLWSSLFLF